MQFVCCCCGCRSCYVRRQHESQKEEEAPLENAKKQFHKAIAEFQAVINETLTCEIEEKEGPISTFVQFVCCCHNRRSC